MVVKSHLATTHIYISHQKFNLTEYHDLIDAITTVAFAQVASYIGN